MRSIFQNIKLAFSAKARAELISAASEQDKQADKQEQVRRTTVLDKQHIATPDFEPIAGWITTEDLMQFNSGYARDAVASMGMWSAVARGFQEFIKNPESNRLDTLCGEFHAWNAVCTSEQKQMDDEQTLALIAKLSQVKPAKGNNQTDAILARILKKSIDEVQADREAKAKVQTDKREAHIIQFNTLLWSCVFSDNKYQMAAQKALDKLEQTLLWMASWDTTNPASLAAELLLIEADMKTVRTINKKGSGAVVDFEEGVMCSDTLSRMVG